MKRGKDEEEKRLEPMFPRLHVNDAADKGGGPRAPPRNKMALYEHLTIPSHRFTHPHASLPRHSNTLFPPPGPSNQACGVERNLTSQHLDSSSSASGHVTQTSFMENVTTLPHRPDQRKKTVREEDDFAVPVYNTNTSTRFKYPGKRTKSDKRSTLFRDQDGESVNASLRQESRSSRSDQDGVETGVMEKDDGVESHGNPNGVDNVGEYSTSGRYVSMQRTNEEEACDDDELMVDSSLSSVDVSPDEVVGVLGQKRFWRARKAIANQQRIFAVQLFELHRLIKVQRLIASSSDVLLDEISYLGKVATKSFPVKKLLPSEFIVKPPLPHATKHRSDDLEKTDQHNMECSAENVVEKLPNQPSNYMPFASDPPAAVNGCYYPPQPPPPSGGNQQWLIPVMSPSEGLIYKPHPGPGHTGPPVCGGYYGHLMPAPMVMGSFMGGGGPPPFHQAVGFQSPGNGYFPPYGMMNPYGSGQQQQQQQQQPNEQMNQFVNPGNVQYASSAVNIQQQQQQSSVNEEISLQQPTKSYPRGRKSRQRSRGSSPSGKNSLRPLSVVDDDDKNEHEQMMTTTTTTTRTTVTQTTRDGGGVTRVIKVVPHNAKLASENAARIFRSIQEERKHYDSFTNHHP